jgi:MSHA biogenesis protein MshP
MRPEPTIAGIGLPLRQARGFSIVSAIFLLVVLSLLGSLMLTFSTVQHVTGAQDVQGSRAYQAARAGIEWGLYQLKQNSSCANVSFVPGTNAFGGTLSGFKVTVACVTVGGPYNEAGTSTTVYQITSTATSGSAPGNLDYVERQLRVTAEH